MTATRTERDSMGELAVPADALYGAQTQRAVQNFPISGRAMPRAFILALLQVKSAAARANSLLGEIPEDVGAAIIGAANALLEDDSFMAQFPVDVFQTGSGTSSNMNANEVLATLASQRLGQHIDPNDHVNRGQSSNDVIPTTLHVSAVIALREQLLPALERFITTTRKKADSVSGYIKTGRTHLMDAMPVRLSQSLLAWAGQMEACRARLEANLPELQLLAQGGTAVGTGINAHPDFANAFSSALSDITGYTFQPANNPFIRIGSQDAAVALSGDLRLTAVALMKIANDLRWMNSGPLAGLGEIELEALQPGSSIMPGKVNPVIPEATAMVCAQVMGNDASVAIAGQSGNFELNVMLPLIADRLLDSIGLLANASQLLADKCIATFRVRETSLQEPLARNPILVTALNPVIGYQKAAEIAKLAYAQGRPILDVAEENSALSRSELETLLDPAHLADGG
ncbi:class II fumarate hydratase [Parahaliea maris]|uniref:Fumarate hydratase class II n=1 Tax=Parahaliea maris TaxID=2716870 RepID=A0A5C8ZYV2_9GAMM|nr:class II fumarate hydratase [Parahaliea maris]TXS93755.1 class II fumarate hydratase [Parahaliea maris]